MTPEDKLIPTKTFKDGEWNDYRCLLAEGARIQTWINGKTDFGSGGRRKVENPPRGFYRVAGSWCRR